MIFSIDQEACVACLACVRVCPTGAVEVQDPLVRIVDESCIRCGLCAIRCPTDAMTMERFQISERFAHAAEES